MIPIAHYLVAAARSGFMKPDGWKRWADQRIARESSPEDWLLDVALANELDALRNAVDPRFQEELRLCDLNSAIGDAVIGYYFHQYRLGTMDLQSCLKLVGQEADSGNCELECEEAYGLLNRLDAAPSASSGTEIQVAASDLLEGFEAKAIEQWRILNQAT